MRGERRLALDECPVSYISGDSVAFREDFLAHVVIPSAEKLGDWPARRVDAFAVLYGELNKLERRTNAEE